jgi:type II secretory pathway component PulF
MAVFTFRGQNSRGEGVSGAADSRQALALALRREQILLIDAQEKKATTGGRFEFGGNPTPKDVAVFTRQFSVMIDSGVPLVQCLEILADAQESRKFTTAIKGVTTEVESGNSLALWRPCSRKLPTSMKKKWTRPWADLRTAMEPKMIVVLGVVVGGIVISMYLPIFTLVSQLSK